MRNMLDRIIAHKQREVANAKANLPLSEIEVQARAASATRGFLNSIQKKIADGESALIAEIKKASPSKGLIREDFDPAGHAIAYEAAGAACLSVLTDVPFFQGHQIYLKEARTACSLPVLRKDFLIDIYQVVEARAWGADCILIIMAAVNDETAHSLANIARKWDMDVLVEVHNREELERALKLNTLMIGINNRDLQTFDIKLEVTEGLAPLIPDDRIIISESGISTVDDIQRLSNIGVNTFLVGESLMRQNDIENATRILLGKPIKELSHDKIDPSVESEGGDATSSTQEEVLDDDFQAAVQELGAMIGQAEEDTEKTPPDVDKTDDKSEKPDSTEVSVEEKTGDKLSHVNEQGEAHMVDVSDKDVSSRIATAEGFIFMKADTLTQIQQNTIKKGDVLATARLAGIMGAKKTSDLIPLCHPLALTNVDINFLPQSEPETGIKVTASVKVDGKTGVEMEALSAVSIACLTIYDMAKAIDRSMCFSGIRLIEKRGGKSGTFRASDAAE